MRLINSRGSPDSPPNPHLNELKRYIATFNVSPQAPGPHCRGFEVANRGALKGFVEELRRVKDKGVVVSAMYNDETAIITVDAPDGL